MGIPQIIVLVLWVINLLITANKHGQARAGKESIWVSLIVTAINAVVLVWGGFFKF